MSNDLIASDHPLTPSQQAVLGALLDTLLPASDDGRLPSASELDFVGYLSRGAADFLPALSGILDGFPEDFGELPYLERLPLVEALRDASTELFNGLLFHVYGCYYIDDRVLEGIGVGSGPPFPRGNTLEAGDLSLLDPVIAQSKTYRR
jgi:hypothetical protein